MVKVEIPTNMDSKKVSFINNGSLKSDSPGKLSYDQSYPMPNSSKAFPNIVFKNAGL